MGYYTAFTLRILDSANQDVRPIIAQLRDNYPSANYALNEDGDFEESCKWYECEDEMKEFSRSHPELVFMLEGDGEESNDQWLAYFKDGQMQYCKGEMVFPDYDASWGSE